jgi:uncharacterized membrane protein YraQ (UPF0718 family)
MDLNMSNYVVERTFECPIGQCINKESIELCKNLIKDNFWQIGKYAIIGMIIGAVVVKIVDYLMQKFYK